MLQLHFPLVCSRISSSCILDCKHMTLAISMLKIIFLLQLECKLMALAISMLSIIFPLRTDTQNYHLKYPNVLH